MSKSKADKLIDYIFDGFKIVVAAAVCIYASYYVIKILAGDLPAWIGGTLVGLLVVYIAAVKTGVTDFFKK